VWTSVAELQEDRKELTSLKERGASLVEQLRKGDEQRQVLRQEIEPLGEAALVQELSLAIEEVLDIELQSVEGFRRHGHLLG